MTHPIQCGRWGSLPLHMGGLGLRSAVRTAPAAHWASWADCLHTISERHAHIAHTMTDALISPSAAAVHLTGAVRSRASLAESGFVCPEWTALVEGLRPNHLAATRWIPRIKLMVGSSSQFNESNPISEQKPVWPRLAPTEQALLRSQSGTNVWSCVLCRSFVTTHSPCAAALPGAVASPSLAPPPSHFSHMPVWPTTRSSWPQPCSVSESRSVGQSVIFCGKRRCQGCVGKQRPGFHKSLCQGLGPVCRSSRCSSVGGGRGWPASLWGGPVGHRHHSYVSGACRWGTPAVSAPVRTGQPSQKLAA